MKTNILMLIAITFLTQAANCEPLHTQKGKDGVKHDAMIYVSGATVDGK